MTDHTGRAPDDDLEALAAASNLDADEAAQVAYMHQLIDAERRGERTTLVVGPFTAMTMIGLLQLATRHPGMLAGQLKVARDIIDQFHPLFAGTPGAELIRRGGHPDFDK